jgi:hypothetical protein
MRVDIDGGRGALDQPSRCQCSYGTAVGRRLRPLEISRGLGERLSRCWPARTLLGRKPQVSQAGPGGIKHTYRSVPLAAAGGQLWRARSQPLQDLSLGVSKTSAHVPSLRVSTVSEGSAPMALPNTGRPYPVQAGRAAEVPVLPTETPDERSHPARPGEPG